MKAVLVDSYGQVFPDAQKLYREAGIDLYVEHIQTDEEYLRKCRDADILLIQFYKTHRGIIQQLERCKVMVRCGIGVDAIEIPACSERKIAVCNVPDYCVEEVAVHAVTLALDCVRMVTCGDRQVRRGQWYGNQQGDNIRRLSTLTYGICGFGNIARTVARFAKGFGCRLIGYDPYVGEDVFRENGAEKVSLEELCRTADIISNHIPLKDDTHHLFAKPLFQTMKRGVIFVNTSRGGLVCTEDLCDAVDAGIVKAAGLDVLEEEPLEETNARILGYDNIVITPHCAAGGVEAMADLWSKAFATPLRILRGELPPNIVNRQALQK